MRLSEISIRLAAFALAALLCWIGARFAVATVESRSVQAVRNALAVNGQDFASVLGDGLQVILEGQASTEAVRFRAISTAGSMVDASRVIDNMTVQASDALQAPEFSMEILRNDSGISLIGLIPTASDRDGLIKDLSRLVGDAGNFANFVETADYDTPEGWDATVNFAVRALRLLPRSKISVRAGRVSVEAISDSAAEKASFENELRRITPQGQLVTLNIMAPRPVVSPFVTRFVKDAEGARFVSCVADTAAAERRIVAASEAAGVEGRTGCSVALGAPTARWADAVVAGLNAVDTLGAGTVTLSDTEVTLVAEQGTVQGMFDRVAGELENTLPPSFALEAILPQALEAGAEGPPQFVATLSPEGLVQLSGPVSDELLNTTAENFARARFGSDGISMATRVVEGLPNTWPVRVLAGVDALSNLSNGSITVEPDTLVVQGNSGVEDASAIITRLLVEKLGSSAEFDVAVTYVKALDPIASIPTDEECLDQIHTILADRKIAFEPGSANIAGTGGRIMDDIADILRECMDMGLEIAGFTDSQGSEDGNQRLSQQRANAVLDALRLRRVPVSSFRAVGYGEADPIADNETEEGREANRRIEFTLITSERTEEPTALEQIEAEAAAADQADDGEEATQ